MGMLGNKFGVSSLEVGLYFLIIVQHEREIVFLLLSPHYY